MNSESNQSLSTMRRALMALSDMQAKLNAVESTKTEPIAIIGMGCRLPGRSDNPAAFWELVKNKTDAITEVPSDRWDIDTYYSSHQDVPGKMNTRYGGFIGNADKFDSQFFGIAPREAVKLDPQQRLLLEVTWEALESANIVPENIIGSATGVFIGISTFDYAMRLFGAASPSCIDAYAGTGTLLSPAAGRISYLLGLNGPSMAVDTACSSSLLAVHLACQSLRNRECNLALAGGVNRLLAPGLSINFAQAGMLAPDGRCKTFDRKADGFVRGEGCGAIVLKRLSDALADGNTILAVIRGSAVNQDGRTSGLTAPNGPSQQAVIRQALANAKIAPHQVDYVEAHGTGTSLGDPIEVGALGAVFSQDRPSERPLIIGSVKTNIGHLEAAAGISSLIKVVLCLQHQEIPANLHFQQPNPYIPWEELPIKVAAETIPWLPEEKRRIAGVSSFGFAGTNVHVVLEETPNVETRRQTPQREPALAQHGAGSNFASEQDRPLHILTITAKTPQGLQQLAGEYDRFLQKYPNSPIGDLCFTANTGRSHFAYRFSAIASSTTELSQQLLAFTQGQSLPQLYSGQVSLNSVPKVTFFFSGELSFNLPISQQLYDTQPVFRQALDRCAEILERELKIPLIKILYFPHNLSDSYTKIALFALEYALCKLWQSWGVTPNLVVGYGVGEYVAACIAGVFNLEDGLKLVAAQSNSSRNLVAKQLNYSQPQINLISSKTGNIIKDEISNPSYWHSEINEHHDIQSIINRIIALKSEFCLEIGLGSTNKNLLALDRIQWLSTLNPQKSDWQELLNSLAVLYINGVGIDWRGFDQHYLRNYLQLPTYPWQRQRYWLETSTNDSLPQLLLEGHPLIGKRLSSPLKTIQFQSYLARSQPSYLLDHQVYNRIILPTTAYLEMALAAIVSVWSSSDFTIENLHIQQPLVIPQVGQIQIQLILTPETQNSYSFEIFSSEIVDDIAYQEWRLHASGKMVKLAAKTTAESLIDLNLWQNQLESITTFYQQLQDWGIELKASFQTLKQIWQQGDLVRGRIEFPEFLTPEISKYQFHPVLLDGSLQVIVAALMHEGAAQSYLPIGVDKYQVYGNVDTCLWIEGKRRSLEKKSSEPIYDLRLFNSNGKEIATLLGVQFQPVSQTSFLENSSKLKNNFFYNVEWINQVKFGSKLNLATPLEIYQNLKSELALPQITDNILTYEAALTKINILAVTYIIKGFDRLGWRWQFGHKFTSEELAQKIGLASKYYRWLNRILKVFAEFGLIKSGDRAWEVIQLPNFIDPQAYQIEILAECSEAEPEVTFVTRCGSRLAQVLTGECDPLDLLFPQGDFNTLRAIYQHSPVAVVWNRLVQKAVESAIKKFPSSLGVRVLEIGAGTGGTTADLLPIFQPKQTEYVFSDVAAIFTTQAAQKFAEFPFVKYQVLDIEIAPELQGFSLGQYDIIVAANVCHATANLSQTLAHIKSLLAPGGLLILLEETLAQPWIDITFGLTEGWWKFTDIEWRKNYPLLKTQKWLDLLCENGFNSSTSLADVEIGKEFGQPSLILAQTDLVSQDQAASKNWLILADRSGVAPELEQLLKMRSNPCILVWAGTEYQQISSHEFYVNPREPQDFQQLLNAVQLTSLDGIVHCWSLDATDTDLEAAALISCGSTLHLIQTLAEANLEKSPPLWLVTQTATAPISDDLCSGLVQSPLWGMGTAIALEHPELNCVQVDLSGEDIVADVQSLFAEISLPQPENRIAFRHGKRWVPRLVRATLTDRKLLTFRSDATYLMTGGLGGLGLVIAKWLVEQGARHLVLVGRSGVQPLAEIKLAELAEMGAKVTVKQADVTQSEQVAEVLAEIKRSLPPLRGIIHAVGVLDDGTIQQLSWERFMGVMAPKVAGAWHLHCLTQDLPLDYFVMFSSVAALLGNAGQANHAAANAFLDALAYHRRAMGLPGLSINWGPWAEIGAAADPQFEEKWTSKGMTTFTPTEGLQVLEEVLSGNFTQVGAVSIDWSKFMAQRAATPFLAEFITATATVNLPPEDFLQQLTQVASYKRRALLVEHICNQIAGVLSLPPSEIDVHLGFFDMGMDSLTSIELRNRLQTSLSCNLPSTLAFKYPTVEKLAQYLTEEVLSANFAEEYIAESPVDYRVNESSVTFDGQSEEELASLLAEKLANMDE
ncbi:SDR family NAD(P)-dependent oxidoreductase [Brasilonema sp. CT11]|nr:SDR family NAD(P)-dependent oxidoreductase [Brasilonema sp. CT11]